MDWVKCSDKLPADQQRVNICTSSQNLLVGVFMSAAKSFVCDGLKVLSINDVPYWMPMITPPKQ